MSTLPDSPFLDRLVCFLIPYFTSVTSDLAAARQEALDTLASYGARTRAELLCAVQTIALSLAALETLTEAKTQEMSDSLRLRYRNCANTLNRNCQKTEAVLAKRLACDLPVTPTRQDRTPDTPDAEAPDVPRQTQTAIQAPHSPPPTPQRPQDRNTRLWGEAMMETLAEMGMPVRLVVPSDHATSSNNL